MNIIKDIKKMKFNLNIDYKRPDDDKSISNSQLTLDYINFAVNMKFKDGLEGQKKRIWGRLQRKLDEAQDIVELESAEVDFIKDAFSEDLKVPPGLAKYFIILEDCIKEELKID